MPLVVMCGFPSSGKTTRVAELKTFMEEAKQIKTTVVSDHRSDFEKNHVYSESLTEKELRSSLKSDVQRFINKEDVLILDSLNYIKGMDGFVSFRWLEFCSYRYELYCITKSAQTPHCLIHCCASKTEAFSFNESRPEGDRYTEEVFNGLVMRFETPDSRNRWDSPVFTVRPEDELPKEQIYEALFLRKPPPPNLSTLPQPLSDTNLMHEMDKITQTIISSVCEAQKTGVPGDLVTVPEAKDKVELFRIVPVSELQRLRRQFIAYAKTHSVDDRAKIANMFVQFLNSRTK